MPANPVTDSAPAGLCLTKSFGCTSSASDGASENGASRLQLPICANRNDCGTASAMATSSGAASSTPTIPATA